MAIRYMCRNIEDHPRRCGENLMSLLSLLEILGSPPQVRGKPREAGGMKQSCRITPAGAGKTYFFGKILKIEQDHPRRCGEN